MKEELFKIIKFFLICFFSLSMSFEMTESQLSKSDFMPQINSNCNQVCIDFLNKNKSYFGLNYRVSHNLILSMKSSLENKLSSYNYIHRQYGFNYLSYENNNNNFIFSLKSNKSLYHNNKSFSWSQIDGIFIRNFNKFNIHLNFSTSFDKNWSSRMITSICEFQVSKIVKVYFGVITYFNYTNEYNGIFALSFVL